MPTRTEYVPAEVYLKHNDVTVYHVYKDNDVENGIREYWFDTAEDSDDDNGFDVRDIATQLNVKSEKEYTQDVQNPNFDEWRRRVIKAGIDAGLIKTEDE